VTKESKDKNVHILLVEDNPADARLLMEAMKEYEVKVDLSVVTNGEEAMSFLYKKVPYENVSRPDLIILDLNLPRKDGREVLADVKSDEDLLSIPIIILTTSTAEKDIITTYKLHANCYIKKPVDLDEFYNVVEKLSYFWISIVRLPVHE